MNRYWQHMLDLFSRREPEKCSDVSSCSKLRVWKAAVTTQLWCVSRGNPGNEYEEAALEAAADRSYGHSSSPSVVGAISTWQLCHLNGTSFLDLNIAHRLVDQR